MPVRVHVKNFQSIREAEVEIDGFTVVTGTNNTGKTALQRAIKGVFQNTPGTSFIREGETTCQVTLDLGDRKVTWSKGTGKKDRPTYILDGGAPIYPGLGVPDEVTALGVAPIQAGGQEVWPTIAPQFSGQIFLLDKPGSVVAEAVADVERVGQLNRALTKAESDRRTAAATLKTRESDLVGLEAQAKRFQGLDEVEAAVTALEVSHAALQKLARAVQGLTGIRDRLTSAQGHVRRLAPVADLSAPSDREAKELRGQLEVLRGVQQRLQRARQETKRYSGVEKLATSGDETPCRRLLDGLKVLKTLDTRLQAATCRVEGLELELVHAMQEGALAEAEFKAALTAMGQCPTCGVSVGGS
jgi:DNA repair ATPase RecN